MKPSFVQTLSIPGIGQPNSQPSRLTQAGSSPMRLAVRNVGGAMLFLSYEVNALTDISQMGGLYQLPVGASEVFVLAPNQSLYAAALGGGGLISIAASEAIPVKYWQES